MTSRVAFRSPHSPTEVARLLTIALGRYPSEDSPTRIAGRGDAARFSIWQHRQYQTNSFKTVFAARLYGEGSGTRIEGRIGTPRMVVWFMRCWFAIAGFFAVVGVAVAILVGMRLPIVGVFAMFPVGMLGFGLMLARLGQRTSAADRAAIQTFLVETIGAHRV